MKDYRRRIIDGILDSRLESKGAILIEGPKWCGKTTTAMRHSRSQLILSRQDKFLQTAQLLEVDTSAAIAGEAPLLIDEWQELPQIWDAVRYEVDSRGLPGQFILTGSAVPVPKKKKTEQEQAIRHSGTGRFAWLTMRPMSLAESGESTGEVSLRSLFDSPDRITSRNPLTLQDIAFLMCRGGWPGTLELKREAALEQAFDYVEAVTKEDVIRIDGVKRSSARIQKLMRAYARHQASQATIRTLRDDVKGDEASSLDEETIASDIEALRKIFVIEDSEAWNPNLRLKTAIRTTATRYFIDPSIATASLGIGPGDLLADLKTMGLIFETMCVRDLRVFAEALHGKIYHYRDQSGLECDAVIHLRDGRYGLVEVKIGGQTWIDEGAASLNALSKKIDTDKMPAPSFRMVLIAAGDYAYRRPDGVYVVPIGCLKDSIVRVVFEN